MQGSAPSTLPWVTRGKPFLGAVTDLLLVGGVAALALGGLAHAVGFTFDNERFWAVVLAVSYAHFAASTVRLYTRPGVVKEWPFLSIGLPLLTLVGTTLMLVHGSLEGWRRVEGVTLIWSAYHYAAQTFGLATMYAYRSGCRLSDSDRLVLRIACLLPFVHGLLNAHSGLAALLPEAIAKSPQVASARGLLQAVLAPIVLASAPLAHLLVRHRSKQVLPLISVCLMLTNALSWSIFLDRSAFAWAAIAHGVQYLIIITYVHTGDAERSPDNKHGKAYHAITFYVACLGLGYLLFELWPSAYGLASVNLDRPSTFRRVALIINMHHFLIDGYIWRIRRDQSLSRAIEQPAG